MFTQNSPEMISSASTPLTSRHYMPISSDVIVTFLAV
jgi:hypothetical protein